MSPMVVDGASRNPTGDPRSCQRRVLGTRGVTMRRIRIVTSVAVLVALGSCAAPPPDEVWVRDPGSEVSVRITLGQTPQESVRVGQWIDLHADRSTGRWIRVRSKDLEPGVRWLVQPPPAEEVGVESNVRWFVEPEGGAEFNLPTAGDRLSRRVRFAAPGTYTVWAQSHTWGGETVRSNRITVAIRP